MEKVIERLDNIEESIDEFDNWKDDVDKWQDEQCEFNDYIKHKVNKVNDNSHEALQRVEDKIDSLRTMIITLLGGLLVGVIALCGTLVAIIL